MRTKQSELFSTSMESSLLASSGMRVPRAFSAASFVTKKRGSSAKTLLQNIREGKYVGPGCEECRGQLKRPRCKACGFQWGQP